MQIYLQVLSKNMAAAKQFSSALSYNNLPLFKLLYCLP